MSARIALHALKERSHQISRQNIYPGLYCNGQSQHVFQRISALARALNCSIGSIGIDLDFFQH